MKHGGTSRRNWLKAVGAGVGAMLSSGWLAGCAGRKASQASAAVDTGSGARPGSVRIAHLTDFHVQPELGANRGMVQCLRHVQSQRHRPELILNTGDCVMETLRADRARAQVQWDLWNRILKDECSLPIEHCLGNHDHWGWDKARSKTTGNEPGWGKGWALEALGLARPYHAFDRGAWRVVMLDSCQPAAAEFWESRIDDEQFAWLESELKGTTRPVLIASHCPIISPASLLDIGKISGTPEAPAINVRRTHLDSKRLGQLFIKHPHVKLCVSGHLHQVDRADYRGVTYATNPAVCGNWWRGEHLGVFGEMYTLLDLHADGTFDIQHVDYGWTPEARPAGTRRATSRSAEPVTD